MAIKILNSSIIGRLKNWVNNQFLSNTDITDDDRVIVSDGGGVKSSNYSITSSIEDNNSKIVVSGAIHSALEGKINKTSLTTSIEDDDEKVSTSKAIHDALINKLDKSSVQLSYDEASEDPISSSGLKNKFSEKLDKSSVETSLSNSPDKIPTSSAVTAAIGNIDIPDRYDPDHVRNFSSTRERGSLGDGISNIRTVYPFEDPIGGEIHRLWIQTHDAVYLTDTDGNILDYSNSTLGPDGYSLCYDNDDDIVYKSVNTSNQTIIYKDGVVITTPQELTDDHIKFMWVVDLTGDIVIVTNKGIFVTEDFTDVTEIIPTTNYDNIDLWNVRMDHQSIYLFRSTSILHISAPSGEWVASTVNTTGVVSDVVLRRSHAGVHIIYIDRSDNKIYEMEASSLTQEGVIPSPLDSGDYRSIQHVEDLGTTLILVDSDEGSVIWWTQDFLEWGQMDDTVGKDWSGSWYDKSRNKIVFIYPDGRVGMSLNRVDNGEHLLDVEDSLSMGVGEIRMGPYSNIPPKYAVLDGSDFDESTTSPEFMSYLEANYEIVESSVSDETNKDVFRKDGDVYYFPDMTGIPTTAWKYIIKITPH